MNFPVDRIGVMIFDIKISNTEIDDVAVAGRRVQ